MTSVIKQNKKLPLEKAIEYFGGRNKLGSAIGISGRTITYWLRHRNGVPTSIQHCLRIEEATRGLVKARQLNPEFFN